MPFTLGVKDEYTPEEHFSLATEDKIDETYEDYKSFDTLAEKWNEMFHYFNEISDNVAEFQDEVSKDPDITREHTNNEQQYLEELAAKVEELYDFISKRLDVLIDKKQDARYEIESLLDTGEELEIGNDTFYGR